MENYFIMDDGFNCNAAEIETVVKRGDYIEVQLKSGRSWDLSGNVKIRLANIQKQLREYNKLQKKSVFESTMTRVGE